MKKISLYLYLCQTHLRTQDGNIPLLLPHLFERVRDVKRANLFIVLELEEFVSSVSSHIHEDVRAVVSEKALRPRDRLIHSTLKGIRECHHDSHTMHTRQNSQEVLYRDLIAAIIDLDVISIQVQMPPRVAVDAARELITRIARGVIREHENDVRVGNAETLHRAIHPECIRHVLTSDMSLCLCEPSTSASTHPVIEPVTRRTHQNGPIVCVRGPAPSMSLEEPLHRCLLVRISRRVRDIEDHR